MIAKGGFPPDRVSALKGWVKQTLHAGHWVRREKPSQARTPGGLGPGAGCQWVLNELFLQEPVSTPASGSLPMHNAASPSVSLRTCWAPDPGSSWSATCCPRPGSGPTQRQWGQRDPIWVLGRNVELIHNTECASHWPWSQKNSWFSANSALYQLCRWRQALFTLSLSPYL